MILWQVFFKIDFSKKMKINIRGEGVFLKTFSGVEIACANLYWQKQQYCYAVSQNKQLSQIMLL